MTSWPHSSGADEQNPHARAAVADDQRSHS